MLQGSVFITNTTQAVRLPVENAWDSFFLTDEKVTDDFLTERAEQTDSIPEEF